MEESNSFDCMVMDDGDEDTDETISLNDLRLMYAKLQEIHADDSATESELKAKLDELKGASTERKISRLKDEVKEIRDKIANLKKENQILSQFDLHEIRESQSELANQFATFYDDFTFIMAKDTCLLAGQMDGIKEIAGRSKKTTPCQTDLTFPPSFTSLTSFTRSPSSPSPSSSSSCSSSMDKDNKQFNAQDAFIEIQLDRKRQLEDQLKQLKKQMWYQGPEVMLVKLDAYEKMISKSSIRRRRKAQRNQFDCYLEISDNSEKRPCQESSRPPSPSSTNNITNNNGNGTVDKHDEEVVQLFFTTPPKQPNLMRVGDILKEQKRKLKQQKTVI